MIRINNDWQALFDQEQQKDYYLALRQFLKKEYSERTIYPPMNEIFTAFSLCPFSQTKVVIVGQDPYHEEGQAMGLSFSVREGIEEPPSLVNIHKEILSEDVLREEFWSSDLTRWARQGVLLLNSTLTVRSHQANSHKDSGWERFTDTCIKALGSDSKPRVFLLWGSYARSKRIYITDPHHLILESAHPSPLSAYRGFFGNNHFALANEFLYRNGEEMIRW
ncbi:MAG: uracil-DNA glycosylase [Spirochaetales bacterium]|nr:uracil-DNA glycosylase [Spirochaetales bacterium]